MDFIKLNMKHCEALEELLTYNIEMLFDTYGPEDLEKEDMLKWFVHYNQIIDELIEQGVFKEPETDIYQRARKFYKEGQ